LKEKKKTLPLLLFLLLLSLNRKKNMSAFTVPFGLVQNNAVDLSRMGSAIRIASQMTSEQTQNIEEARKKMEEARKAMASAGDTLTSERAKFLGAATQMQMLQGPQLPFYMQHFLPNYAQSVLPTAPSFVGSDAALMFLAMPNCQHCVKFKPYLDEALRQLQFPSALTMALDASCLGKDPSCEVSRFIMSALQNNWDGGVPALFSVRWQPTGAYQLAPIPTHYDIGDLKTALKDALALNELGTYTQEVAHMGQKAMLNLAQGQQHERQRTLKKALESQLEEVKAIAANDAVAKNYGQTLQALIGGGAVDLSLLTAAGIDSTDKALQDSMAKAVRAMAVSAHGKPGATGIRSYAELLRSA
jgi:hypothetical protein